jgi:hypothetical protein
VFASGVVAMALSMRLLCLLMPMVVKGYVLGTNGACGAGYWRVTDYHECRRVVEYQSLVAGEYKGYYTSADEPSGCNKKSQHR